MVMPVRTPVAAMRGMRLALLPALALALAPAPAAALELVGRVVDTVKARALAGARVVVRDSGGDPRGVATDAHGFFRIADIAPGAYLLDVEPAQGEGFAARLLLLPGRRSQFVELDASRIVPPGSDDDH
jgi:hypothetical protein